MGGKQAFQSFEFPFVVPMRQLRHFLSDKRIKMLISMIGNLATFYLSRKKELIGLQIDLAKKSPSST